MRFINLDHLRECRIDLVKEVGSRSGARCSFSEALSILRGFPVSSKEGISVHFSSSEIADLCVKNGIFTDAVEIDIKERDRYENLLSDAMDLIRKSDKNLLDLINLVVTDIVFIGSKRIGGGTASHLPGIACFSPGDNWLAADMAESLLHEATHLSTFLCDMVHGIFTEPCKVFEDEGIGAVSAVRKGVIRPLDKALHSAVVTVPLLYFENILGRDQILSEYGKSFSKCCMEIESMGSYFTEYGQQLVEELSSFSASMDLKQVKLALVQRDLI